jgi:hypothetical protein
MFPFSKLDFHSRKARAKNHVSVAAKKSIVHEATTFLESDFALRRMMSGTKKLHFGDPKN